MLTSTAFKLYEHIKNSSDELTKSCMIHEMYGCQCRMLTGINLFLSIIFFSIVNNLINTFIWRKRNKYYNAIIQKCFFCKKTSTYWKFKDKIFELFLAPNQYNCCTIVLWRFISLLTRLLNELIIDSTAAFPCKTSALS